MIDLSTKHAVAMKNHVPEIILWLLLDMVLIAMFWVELNAGVSPGSAAFWPPWRWRWRWSRRWW